MFISFEGKVEPELTLQKYSNLGWRKIWENPARWKQKISVSNLWQVNVVLGSNLVQ